MNTIYIVTQLYIIMNTGKHIYVFCGEIGEDDLGSGVKELNSQLPLKNLVPSTKKMKN